MTNRLKVSAIGLAMCAAGVFGVAGSAHADAQYKEDVARCKSGQTANLDRTACMKEAAASQVERRRSGSLTEPADAQRNASARCQALPAGQREDCMTAMSGQASTRVLGSVKGGGVLRETVIQVPAGTVGTPQGGYGYGQQVPVAPPPAMPPSSNMGGTGGYGSGAPATYGTGSARP